MYLDLPLSHLLMERDRKAEKPNKYVYIYIQLNNFPKSALSSVLTVLNRQSLTGKNNKNNTPIIWSSVIELFSNKDLVN